jgi:aryl-alcohol dehydrogenase-like predicted oxidoreductase
MNFGSQTGEADSFAIMDRALHAGINFFDTANGYGGGKTEQILGRWFSQGGGRREQVVLATKVYGDVAGDWPNDSKLSARHIRDACDASLSRLQTDHIDLYQMHHVDRDTPWEEIWQAMDLLITQGKVIYVGSSNFAAWHIVAANEAARQRNTFGLSGLRSGDPALEPPGGRTPRGIDRSGQGRSAGRRRYEGSCRLVAGHHRRMGEAVLRARRTAG